MSIVRVSDEEYEMLESEPEEVREPTGEGHMFLKGLIVGFGLAAVASLLLNLFQEQRESRRRSMSPESRFRSHDESGGVLGDLSHVVDESSSAFSDAVRTLDRAFDSGRKAIEGVKDVIDKIREQ